MAWRSSSKHSRPSGRGALKAAYADLHTELGEVRRHRYADSLESARLTALADALSVQVSRLTGELSSVRRELHESRTAPQVRDPYVEVLAAEAAELRAAVASQQAVLVELTARIGELLAREPVAAVPPPAALAEDHLVLLTDEALPFAAVTPSFVPDDIDDLALLRLRLIRQTLTADSVAPVTTSAAP